MFDSKIRHMKRSIFSKNWTLKSREGFCRNKLQDLISSLGRTVRILQVGP